MATNKSEFSVHLSDPTGKVVCIEPGAEIPPWAKKLITNPVVLNGDGAEAAAADDESDDDELADDESDEEGDENDGEDDDEDGDGPPPKVGPGSGTDRWAAYAAEHDVDVEGLNKTGIIAALSEAGVPVE